MEFPSACRDVLIVDNSIDTLEMYALGLGLAGYRAHTAIDAAGAGEWIEAHAPDAVVTELHFERGPHGADLITALRRNPSTRQLPIIVLTVYERGAMVDQVLQDPLVTFITKPCPPEDLVRILQRVLLDTHAA